MAIEHDEAGDRVGQTQWSDVWAGVRLPSRASAKERPHRWRLMQRLLPKGKSVRLLEVGSAPGGNLVLFEEGFGWEVWGIDYSETGHRKTLENMALTGVPAHIVLGDFFTHVFPHNGFDIVFSAGFIEHFVDRTAVLKRMDELTVPGGWIIATWPNLLGLNGWIYRRCDPSSRIEHFVFHAAEVANVLARMGYEIAYCGPIDGPGLRSSFGRRGRWARHPVFRRILRAPVALFNRASRQMNYWLGGLPESNLCSYNQAVFARKKGVSESRV